MQRRGVNGDEQLRRVHQPKQIVNPLAPIVRKVNEEKFVAPFVKLVHHFWHRRKRRGMPGEIVKQQRQFLFVFLRRGLHQFGLARRISPVKHQRQGLHQFNRNPGAAEKGGLVVRPLLKIQNPVLSPKAQAVVSSRQIFPVLLRFVAGHPEPQNLRRMPLADKFLHHVVLLAQFVRKDNRLDIRNTVKDVTKLRRGYHADFLPAPVGQVFERGQGYQDVPVATGDAKGFHGFLIQQCGCSFSKVSFFMCFKMTSSGQ